MDIARHNSTEKLLNQRVKNNIPPVLIKSRTFMTPSYGQQRGEGGGGGVVLGEVSESFGGKST